MGKEILEQPIGFAGQRCPTCMTGARVMSEEAGVQRATTGNHE